MGLVRSTISNSVRRFLNRQGIFVGQRGDYGLDAFMDIQRLAKAWNYPIDLIFDVGANDGDTAAAVLKEFPTARVMSFEPHPTTFATLMTRVHGNPRVQGFNLALGDREGEVAMTVYENSKINSLLPNAPFAHRFEEKGQTIQVKATTLDAFCRDHAVAAIDLLKIDTEGYDLMVLQGAASLLAARAIKFIYVEFNSLLAKEGAAGGALMPIAALLHPFGYGFVSCYNDYITTEGEMFGVSNALFALSPQASLR